MRNMVAANELYIVNNQKLNVFIHLGKRSADSSENNPVSEILTSEGCELRSNSSSSQNKINFDDLENGIVSDNPYIKMLYSIMDSKTNKFMSVRSVSTMLEDHDLKVSDMKEFNVLTYFHSQKVGSTDK